MRSALPPTTEVRPTAPVEPALPTQPGLTQASRPSATQAVSPAPPPPSLELPSSQASYLQNPAPIYPALSKRLGEQGKVLVRVLIGADGLPVQAQLKTSSGFDRLDRAALEYVMRCRYVPGKIGGVPQAMWHEAPVVFVLE